MTFIFYCFLPAETLKCLKCYSSNDAECDKEEKSGICGAFDDTCYSLTYVFVPSGKSVVEHGFKKGCVNRNVGCEMYCRQFLEEGYKSCNVSIYFIESFMFNSSKALLKGVILKS